MPIAKSSMELVWKYGRLSSIQFLKSSFHSGMFHFPYRSFYSIFHSIPCRASEVLKNPWICGYFPLLKERTVQCTVHPFIMHLGGHRWLLMASRFSLDQPTCQILNEILVWKYRKVEVHWFQIQEFGFVLKVIKFYICVVNTEQPCPYFSVCTFLRLTILLKEPLSICLEVLYCIKSSFVKNDSEVMQL